MIARVLAMVMSSSFFNPSFAFSSHFDPDGAPLSELSWGSSLAVVAVSFSGLFTFIFLMLACLCCKKGDIGFKEFENAEGEEYTTELSTQGSPNSQNGPEVYILPLTEVSLPVSKQPGRAVQLLKPTDLGRHSLLYLKEIGQGWFGKLLLGEVSSGLSSTQVVVKELKASTSVQDQLQFLEEVHPYRTLQHPNLLQCLAQCTEVTPHLLIMEFCPLGDLKGYLRSCVAADSMAPDPITLQRMACEIAAGILHLHKHNFIHSDLALRNCLLTADLTVKIGDYGLSHSKYKDDYFITADQLWVALRWIAPELVDDVHGNLLVVNQTKSSNIWSLGVTIWELFEFGNQPYHQYSDRQVLNYAIKEQQLKLPKPQLQLPLSERWYEVMQFCWLQPEQRPTADEVHLLLTYLCVKGTTEAEEEFEKRWNSMKPNSNPGAAHTSEVSSYPLLEQFSCDSFHSDGDDILTVTETSQGLNFEYKWDHSKSEHFAASSGALSQGSDQYRDIYFSSSSTGKLSLGVSPSYYDCKQDSQSLQTPGVVPVYCGPSPSVNSEYYIRIEEPSEGNADLDFTMCSYSPEYDRSSPNESSCWHEDAKKANMYDSDNSPTISLTMEPLLGDFPSSNIDAWKTSQYTDFKCKTEDQDCYQQSPVDGASQHLLDELSEESEEWIISGLKKMTSFEESLGVSPSVISAHRNHDEELENTKDDLDLEHNILTAHSVEQKLLKTTTEGLKNKQRNESEELCHSVTVDIGAEDASENSLQRKGDTESHLSCVETGMQVQSKYWTSNSSSNNNIISCATWSSDPSSSNMWCYKNTKIGSFSGYCPESLESAPWPHTEIGSLATVLEKNSIVNDLTLSKYQASDDKNVQLYQNDSSFFFNKEHYLYPDAEGLGSSNLRYSVEKDSIVHTEAVNRFHISKSLEFVEPLTGAVVQNTQYVKPKQAWTTTEKEESEHNTPAVCNKDDIQLEMQMEGACNATHVSDSTRVNNLSHFDPEKGTNLYSETIGVTESGQKWESSDSVTDDFSYDHRYIDPGKSSEVDTTSPCELSAQGDVSVIAEFDGKSDKTLSSVSLIETDDCSDEDITDITSGVFVDFPSDYNERSDVTPSFKSLQKQVGTPDSLDSLDIPSTASSCDVFIPAGYNSSSQPKALDSGYDTENYESPEFVLKEPHDARESDKMNDISAPSSLLVAEESVLGSTVQISSPQSTEHHDLSQKNPYRDSAYFSDYDAETDRFSKDDLENDLLLFQAACGIKPPEMPDLQQTCMLPEKSSVIAEGPPTECEPSLVFSTALVNTESKQGLLDETSDQQVSTLDVQVSLIQGVHVATEEITPTPLLAEKLLNKSVELESIAISLKSSQDLVEDQCVEYSSMSSFPEPMDSINQTKLCLSVVQESKMEDVDSTSQTLLDRTRLPDSKTDEVVLFQLTECVESRECVESKDQGVALSENSQNDIQQLSTGNDESSGNVHIFKPQAVQLSLPLQLKNLKKEGRYPVTDGGGGDDADEEDEDSDDSDDSDEELCCYNIQEQSEESEEEVPAMPIVIIETPNNKNLRSLLKMPSLMSQSFSEELDRKKKAVSFFDDVTVYLFDQESPTRELTDQVFPEVGDNPPGKEATTPTTPSERQNTSDDSSDGNISEESSGGLEWEDDFPTAEIKPSFVSSEKGAVLPSDVERPDIPQPVAEQKKPVPIQYSRFSVSPAPVSRFSITHVSDSDIESVGGSSEDGERE
ncbi:serine/threonine-protein kinase LMTK1 isoform X2 [Protopterus annectens]|uniref:serine/threonine-protein kinase LMTK1 isoform X2 n=1 Tax=Protopterus annectens TaxID=7888 RepID=UPI001CFB0AD6|nr:serine/threonine-protein kinase LMTK1 isoform X2 [Protopterus annectens]